MKQMYSWYRQGRALVDEIEQSNQGRDGFDYWYLGQMGMAFKWNGHILYIDPVFNDLTSPDGTTRRNYPPPFLPQEAVRPDLILCTHAHGDHLNLETLVPMLQAWPQARLVMPAPEVTRLTEQFQSAGIPAGQLIPAVQEMLLTLLSEIEICPIAAAHPEYLADESGAQYALGYLIRMGNDQIYHAGDTYLTDELLTRLSGESIQLACLPINGRDFVRESQGIIGNMNYREAGYLAGKIAADMTIPLHYDMVAGNGENPLHFLNYMAEQWPAHKCHIMKLGEGMVYKRLKV